MRSFRKEALSFLGAFSREESFVRERSEKLPLLIGGL
jgi:hypothetical protein